MLMIKAFAVDRSAQGYNQCWQTARRGIPKTEWIESAVMMPRLQDSSTTVEDDLAPYWSLQACQNCPPGERATYGLGRLVSQEQLSGRLTAGDGRRIGLALCSDFVKWKLSRPPQEIVDGTLRAGAVFGGLPDV